MQSKFREPVSGLTHVFGAIMSVIGLILLMTLSINNITRFAVFSVFGVSMIMLYSASSIYHLVNFSESTIFLLRKLDHSMIYVLIAGTYTPVCLIALNGILGWGLFIGIWILAILGIILKMFWMEAPRWLYTMFYVFMGWISVFVIAPLGKIVPLSGILWLAAGGVLYTLGAIIYAAKWPRINSKIFGFHEIFHIYVLMGSFCHYWFMLRYVMNV